MVYIIIVNWNGWKDTIECLESLLRLTNQNFQVIICDNNSQDSSIKKIESWARGEQPLSLDGPPWAKLGAVSARRRDPTIQVINDASEFVSANPPLVTITDVHGNLGFAGASNVGMRLALSDPRAEFIWLLNNDTVVDPHALDTLLDRMRSDRSLGILGSCLLYYDHPDMVQSLGGWRSRWKAKGGFIGIGRPINNLPDLAEVEKHLSYVAGASMFLPIQFLNDIGEMCEDYFLYFEEFDWAMRSKSKYRQSVCLESLVYHKEGASIGSNSLTSPSRTSHYYLTVNHLRFTAKYAPSFMPVVFARIAFDLTRHLFSREFETVYIKWIALADFILNRRRRGPIKI